MIDFKYYYNLDGGKVLKIYRKNLTFEIPCDDHGWVDAKQYGIPEVEGVFILFSKEGGYTAVEQHKDNPVDYITGYTKWKPLKGVIEQEERYYYREHGYDQYEIVDSLENKFITTFLSEDQAEALTKHLNSLNERKDSNVNK